MHKQSGLLVKYDEVWHSRRVIDAELLLGSELKAAPKAWDHKDAILYALAVGVDSLDEIGLRRLYEKDLEVLPVFGSIPALLDVAELCALPGADIHFATLLHAQQEVELSGPVPQAADVLVNAKVVGVADKGRNAMIVIDADVTAGAEWTAKVRTTAFSQGEGGFGHTLGEPATKLPAAPDREPDVVTRFETSAVQAAIYRLTGDPNVLHIDPDVAALVGLDRPILHGMCSFGIAVRQVTDALLDADARAVRRMHTRFVGMAYPTDVLETRAWKVDGGALFETVAANRDNAPILAGGGVFIS